MEVLEPAKIEEEIAKDSDNAKDDKDVKSTSNETGRNRKEEKDVSIKTETKEQSETTETENKIEETSKAVENSTEKKEPEKSEKPIAVEENPKSPRKRKSIKEVNPEESDEDREPGLLERPVVIEGKRERKQVERISYQQSPQKEHKIEIPVGKGSKLLDIPRIELEFSKHKAEELRTLHSFLFNRPGNSKQIKRNILQFCGFSFKKEDPEYKRKRDRLNKLTMAQMKVFCKLLDIEYAKTKEEFVNKILDFLMLPKASGKTIPKSQKKGKRASTGKKKAEDESSSEPSPKKAKKETPKKEKVTKKLDKEGKGKGKTTTKKNSTKKGKKGKSKDSTPKKSKEQPPSDDQLREDIKKILETADLEKVTMKKLCETIYDKYPEFDLTSRKYFIKLSVKENLK